MFPIQRDFRFNLPRSRAGDWHGRGAHVSHFFNAMSVFFPVGERYFISSVRAHRGKIRDKTLDAEIRAFIGQEAMHGREHEDYNRLLTQTGFPAQKLERRVARLLKFTQRIAPASWQLASTIALEHFTAILADRLLSDDALLCDSVGPFRDLWLWHSIEETEHKAVAFDVWQQAVGRGAGAYVLRAGGMVVTGAFFVSMIAAFSAEMIESDPTLQGKRRGYLQLLKFLLGRGGLVRSGFPAWLDYFRPSFHPWQHDNRALLEKLDEIESRVNRFELAKAA